MIRILIDETAKLICFAVSLAATLTAVVLFASILDKSI